jgi:putative redox protein
MTWRSLAIPNRRGEKLAALWRAAGPRESAPRAKKCAGTGLPVAPLVIVCHGFTGSKEGGGRAVEMGDALARLGCGTLLFDFSGCGASEGVWEELTLTRQLEDLGDVVAWCRDRGCRSIVLNGRSFGGTAALLYAAADPAIGGVCTWAAVARPAVLFKCLAREPLDGSPDEPVALAGAEGVSLKQGFFTDLERHNVPAAAAALAPRRLLIIHGTADGTVPVTDAALIFETARQPKELALIAGADHRFSNHLPQVWTVFFRWLRAFRLPSGSRET